MAEPRRKVAAALSYPGHGAPKVVAAGKGHVAGRILELAREAGVPTREDSALAQALAELELDTRDPGAALPGGRGGARVGAAARSQPPSLTGPQLARRGGRIPVRFCPRNAGELSPRSRPGGSPVPIDSSNPYTQMQLHHYEMTTDLMNVENHRGHNGNPDYWDILVNDTESTFRDKVGLDFGCGCGRNVQNLWWRFKRMDGVDLSFGNLVHAHENLRSIGCPADRYQLFQANGVDLGNLRDNEYDFVMSTIVLPAHRGLRHPLPVPARVLPRHEAGRPALVPDGLRRGLRQGRLLRQPLPRGEHELGPRHAGHEPGADPGRPRSSSASSTSSTRSGRPSTTATRTGSSRRPTSRRSRARTASCAPPRSGGARPGVGFQS